MKYLLGFFMLLSIVACKAKQHNNDNIEPMGNDNKIMDTITLGGGCFWCIEAVFDAMKGVISAESGYMGGGTIAPRYKEVCTGTTGHAEVVQLCYDTSQVTLEEILEVFFTVHDPTTFNRQGADVGTQYRSVIYYNNELQRSIAEGIIAALNKEDIYGNPVVTEVEKLDVFYKAEDYHQGYYANNPEQSYCSIVIRPKVEKFKKIFSSKLK